MDEQATAPIAIDIAALGTPGAVDQLQLQDTRVIELSPDQGDQVEEPMVVLMMIGLSSLTRKTRVVSGALTPELAVRLGNGMAQSGTDLLAETSSGLVQATSMAQAHAVAKQAARFTPPR